MNSATLAIEVPRDRVLRYMGYPRGRAPARRVARLVEGRWSEALGLVDPRGAWRLVSGSEAREAGMPDPTPVVGVGLCTIGEAVERASRDFSDRCDLLAALFFDAFGSSAAEAAADALNRRLCAEAHRRGHQLQARISPGYGRWAIEGQPRLLALLPARELGITLTEGLMMVPRKSVSFATRVGADDGVAPRDRRRCCRCELLTCPYRDDDGEDSLVGDGRPTHAGAWEPATAPRATPGYARAAEGSLLAPALAQAEPARCSELERL